MLDNWQKLVSQIYKVSYSREESYLYHIKQDEKSTYTKNCHQYFDTSKSGGTQGNTLPDRNQILYVLMVPQWRNTFQTNTQDIDNTNTSLY